MMRTGRGISPGPPAPPVPGGPPARNMLTIIDKRTLEAVANVSEPPGQTLAHVEFTRDGRYALASLWENDGALIVYDAAAFKEIKRLPMKKPAGQYNIFNSRQTSGHR